jgi:hypothetical protein
MQLYRYFVSQSSEFCCHNPLCCFSTSVYCCKRIFRYDLVRKFLDTPSYEDGGSKALQNTTATLSGATIQKDLNVVLVFDLTL